MQHAITKETMRVTLARPFDYLAAGETYRATPSVYRSGKRKGQISHVRFDRDDESCGTFIQPYQWRMMLAADWASVTPYGREA